MCCALFEIEVDVICIVSLPSSNVKKLILYPIAIGYCTVFNFTNFRLYMFQSFVLHVKIDHG